MDAEPCYWLLDCRDADWPQRVGPASRRKRVKVRKGRPPVAGAASALQPKRALAPAVAMTAMVHPTVAEVVSILSGFAQRGPSAGCEHRSSVMTESNRASDAMTMLQFAFPRSPVDTPRWMPYSEQVCKEWS